MLVLWRKEPQKQILSLHKILPTSKAVLGATSRIETLENALNHSIKAAENNKRKQMIKFKKKKKKKHEEQIKAMDKKWSQ